ncbi:MAG TPA: NAD(P)-dependent oxidoreductase [Chitinophagaceae bacterium]|nr:NAD(P)-dependent oxidoreductase [Chitinophagaceae bacterium]
MITGATAGFGAAIATTFARKGYRLIITGRRTERLQQLAVQLQAEGNEVLPLVFDVQDRTAVKAAIDGLPVAWRAIDILVNNAGLALGRDTFHEANLDDWDTMIDTNVKGLLYVSHAVAPLMIAQGSGHIINIGSIAGKEVYPAGNGYCATKHAVDAISKSQRIDLLPYGIKVTAVHPGAAETEFSLVRFKGDAAKAAAVYQGFTPLSAQDIADVVAYVATVPKHVCINDIVVMPTAQANSTTFFKQ